MARELSMATLYKTIITASSPKLKILLAIVTFISKGWGRH